MAQPAPAAQTPAPVTAGQVRAYYKQHNPTKLEEDEQFAEKFIEEWAKDGEKWHTLNAQLRKQYGVDLTGEKATAAEIAERKRANMASEEHPAQRAGWWEGGGAASRSTWVPNY